ncbi:class I SAM-dependent methyltransferase [Fructilactobacillus myrtifloralis]|uniref:Class I SAM-dependent methyltransferase n=1 Tax=Fructilactobacillus myrtifloralis TaxID=2940301 RepID=A0ABY5BQ91_9LACO|nr:class I SAM-dependent methyltransferase [Fructilactobacillus myrtifloralis]USS85207.1 class I SAM-dependent methyltransferase [Fructilactobacillus myrtifloralis]
MTEEQITKLFQVFDQSAELLQQALDTSYLDAFIETADNMIDDNRVRVEDGVPTPPVVTKLTNLYQQVDYHQIDANSIRKAIQMVMIKAIKVDQIQAIHQITPDTIAYTMGYLAIRLVKPLQQVRLLDPAVGSANLLTAVMNQLQDEAHEQVAGVGIDNDDSLISVASISTQMQGLDVELVHQDALDDLPIAPVNLVVSDLPIGYYPVDDRASQYLTRAASGHSYVHHLLIEQAVNHLEPGGFGIFLVPSDLFQSPETKGLLKWMQDHVYLQGILNLPGELFQNEVAQKAIMIVQKQGAGAHQASQVMLGEFPSFKDPDAFQKFLAEVVEWEEHEFLPEHK